MPHPTEEEIQQLKEKFPGANLHTLVIDGTDRNSEAVICKAPSRGDWKRFMQMTADKDRRNAALETLVRGCLVWPDAAAFDEMLEDKPGLCETFGTALTRIAGLQGDAESKKL